MPSTSSIASDVSATLSHAASQRRQNATASQNSQQEPFEALLDAGTPPSTPANPPPAAQQPAPQTAAPANGSAAKSLSTDRPSSGGTKSPLTVSSTSNAGSGKKPDQGAIHGTSATRNAPHDGGAADGKNADDEPNAATDPASTPTPADPSVVAGTGASAAATAATAATAAANALNTSTAAAPAPVSPIKTTAGDDDDKADDDTATAEDGTATPQPTSNPPQPIAAAIVIGAAVDATPPAANATAATTAIGDAKPRVKVTLPVADDQDAPTAPQGNDTTTATPAAPANAASGPSAAHSGSPDNSANAPAPTDGAPQQAQADSTAVVLAQNAATPQPNTDHAAPRSDSATATSADVDGSSAAQTTAAKTDTPPNFGFAGANTAAPSAAAAAPGAAPAATVPIAGLAVAITTRALAGSNQFDIRLDPPELGRIDVRLDVDRDGQVTSHVTVDRADTLTLLQSQQTQLERALEQAGLKTADNGLQFTLRDQSFTGQNNNGAYPQPNTAHLVAPDADLPPVATTQIYSRVGRSSGVDIRV